MAILSAEDVARHCHRAGFRGSALLTIVAIAKAESGFEPAAVGDTTITDETWGPSVGLLQVRSLRAERGTGRTRDELANSDPAHNALAGWEISAHGTRFTPWSVFGSGAYLRHLALVLPPATRSTPPSLRSMTTRRCCASVTQAQRWPRCSGACRSPALPWSSTPSSVR